jgi:hypothetical protein
MTHNDKFVYILAPDDYLNIDNIDYVALNIDDLKKLLIEKQARYFSRSIIENSIRIKETKLYFKYKTGLGDVISDYCDYFKLPVWSR